MRILSFLCILYIHALLPVSAQQFKRIFLFDEFCKAQVKFRNHTATTLSLNYDASNKTMLFMQYEDILEVTNPALIDTITVEQRKFVPATKGFHEVIYMKYGAVLIDWLLKDVNVGSKGALGSVTQGSVHNLQMNDLGLNGTEMYTPYKQQKIGSTDVYRRKNDNIYYIKVNGELKRIKTIKHLEKQFPAHQQEIREYAKKNGINMKEVSDALDILDYCMAFML